MEGSPARHVTHASLASRLMTAAKRRRCAPTCKLIGQPPRRYQWTSQRHTLPSSAPTHRATWSSCGRRTGGPPSLPLWLLALRAAASLPCCDHQTSKTWIQGSRRRASATSLRPSPVRARGRRSKRISACASATICGCTAGGDDDGNASTRPLYRWWPRGLPRRRRFVRRPRPARRRRASGRRRAHASRTRQGGHRSRRA